LLKSRLDLWDYASRLKKRNDRRSGGQRGAGNVADEIAGTRQKTTEASSEGVEEPHDLSPHPPPPRQVDDAVAVEAGVRVDLLVRRVRRILLGFGGGEPAPLRLGAV